MSVLLHGDCRDIVPEQGMFDLVFADPPFNIDHPYIDYKDKRQDYSLFTSQWVRTCWDACSGVMALHGPDALADSYLGIARSLGMRRIAWLNWHYRFGQCTWSNWIDARCHCLVFAKNDDYTWNPEEVAVESDRVKSGDKRIHDTERGGRRPPGTVWGVPSDGPHWGRVQGNNKERCPSQPNQLPELYLERLIRAYTNKGDRVLDPFCGAGTTAVVSDALGRDCLTIDVSEHAIREAEKRVKRGSVRVSQETRGEDVIVPCVVTEAPPGILSDSQRS